MKLLPHAICSFSLVLFATGCVSVPQVESRLQSLQFYPNMYVVQAGDTLDTIAFRYQLDRNDLVALNPGVGGRVVPGMRINVRPGTELSDEIRAGTGYGLTQQPRIVDDTANVEQAALVEPVNRATVNPETVIQTRSSA